MSATLDEKIFAMFPDGERLEIEGRTFPVEVHYGREMIPNYDLSTPNSQIDYDAIVRVVKLVRRGYFDKWEVVDPGNKGKVGAGTEDPGTRYQTGRGEYEGLRRFKRRFGKAILVFLPGVGEINMLCRKLVEHSSDDYDAEMSQIPEHHVLPLHASLSQEQQKRCFVTFDGKIVVSTNVCETSITIPDVTCVIDSCREKRLQLVKKFDIQEDYYENALPSEIEFVQSSASEMCTLRLPVLQERFCSN
eukprot:g14908.t1